MNETPMNSNMLPSHTVNPVGEKAVLIKTTGDKKHPFFSGFVLSNKWYKAKTDDYFQEDHAKGGFSIVHVHQNGWMDDQGVLL